MSKSNIQSLLIFFLGTGTYWLSYNFLDQPIANSFHHLVLADLAKQFYQVITLLGDPKASLAFVVVSFIFAVLILLRYPQNKMANTLLSLCIAMLVAILFEISLKYLIGRYRPELFFEQGLYGFHYLSGEFLMNSSPSGHATRAFVLVTGLSLTWKRLAPLFILIGLAVCLSRIALEFHYLSDVIFGALLGTLVTLQVRKMYYSLIRTNSSYAH